ncbi:MAG: PIN domain-containing protein [Pseudomonadota bacterium]
MIYLDTHVVAWLYAGRSDLLSPRVGDMLRESDILISPIAVLELQYLYEIERIGVEAQKVVDELKRSIGLKLCTQAFSSVVEKAALQSWTRDPFDRVIVAQAAMNNSPLATRDKEIQNNYSLAVWE